MTDTTGRCHCGQIQYSVAGPVVQVVACHCGLCRGMTGAAFSSYAVVQSDRLTVTQGRGVLAAYAVTERTTRHFCNACGTPIFNSNPCSYPGLAMLYLGTVAGHELLAPKIDLYCESRLPWVRLHESCKSFAGAPTRPA